MIGADIEDYPIQLEKGEVVQEIKKNLKIKWQRKLSEKVEQSRYRRCLQKIKGNRNCCGEKDRKTFSVVNHYFLNSHKATMDPNVSSLCSACHMTEDTFHFIFRCDLFRSKI